MRARIAIISAMLFAAVVPAEGSHCPGHICNVDQFGRFVCSGSCIPSGGLPGGDRAHGASRREKRCWKLCKARIRPCRAAKRAHSCVGTGQAAFECKNARLTNYFACRLDAIGPCFGLRRAKTCSDVVLTVDAAEKRLLPARPEVGYAILDVTVSSRGGAVTGDLAPYRFFFTTAGDGAIRPLESTIPGYCRAELDVPVDGSASCRLFFKISGSQSAGELRLVLGGGGYSRAREVALAGSSADLVSPVVLAATRVTAFSRLGGHSTAPDERFVQVTLTLTNPGFEPIGPVPSAFTLWIGDVPYPHTAEIPRDVLTRLGGVPCPGDASFPDDVPTIDPGAETSCTVLFRVPANARRGVVAFDDGTFTGRAPETLIPEPPVPDLTGGWTFSLTETRDPFPPLHLTCDTEMTHASATDGPSVLVTASCAEGDVAYGSMKLAGTLSPNGDIQAAGMGPATCLDLRMQGRLLTDGGIAGDFVCELLGRTVGSGTFTAIRR